MEKEKIEFTDKWQKVQYKIITGDDPVITVKTKGWICYCFVCRFRRWDNGQQIQSVYSDSNEE